MNAVDAAVVAGEIKASLAALEKLRQSFQLYEENFFTPDRRDVRDAVFLADILCRTYTCAETVCLRISRAFENHLDRESWHKDLLHKMRLEIPGIRPAVLSETLYFWLDSLRRFRHFQRYYYDVEFDWDRLQTLAAEYREKLPVLTAELQNYMNFCVTVSAEKSGKQNSSPYPTG